MLPLPVMLDVDTGVDDALAIAFAVRHPALDVRAITCVAGNTQVDQVVRNTLTVLDLLDAPDIAVARGAERPLLAEPMDAEHVHGSDGLAGHASEVPYHQPVAHGAVELLREQITSSERPVTLVTLGPMTNIALLLRTYPVVIPHLERIVFMGGAVTRGNATPVAEFNVWHDPEAAAIVVGSGVKLTMYGLDVFHQVGVPRDAYEPLSSEPDPGTRLVGDLLAHMHGVTAADPQIAEGGLIGDAGALCAVADPEGLTTGTYPVRVDTAPGLGYGQTLVDRRVILGEDEAHGVAGSAPPVDVAVDVDADRYRTLFLQTITGTRIAG